MVIYTFCKITKIVTSLPMYAAIQVGDVDFKLVRLWNEKAQL